MSALRKKSSSNGGDRPRRIGKDQQPGMQQSASLSSQQPASPGRAARRAGGARLLAALLGLWMLLLAGAVEAQVRAPGVGTIIRNTATVSYNGPAGAITSYPSNEVSAVVQQVAAFTLASSQTRATATNTQVVFSHTITNTGNGPDRFVLTATNPAPGCNACGGFNFSSALISPDVAPQDGQPDGPPAAGLTTPLLAQGQSYTFVLVAQVPSTATAGQFAQAQVGAQGDAATAAAGGFAAAGAQANTDQANVSAAGVITTSKTFSTVSGPSPGAGNVTVTITYTNNSGVAAANVRIQDWIGQTNGAPVSDTTGMRYVAGSARWSGCNGGAGVLSDALDGFEAACTAAPVQRINYQFTATATPGVGVVDAVIEAVPANTSGQLRFEVQVISGLPVGGAQTTNAARISYCDSGVCGGGTNQTSDTNQAIYQVTPVTGVDLTVTKTIASPLAGRFSIGNPGEFQLQVNNIGALPSTGTITVTDTLPGGLEVTGITATGWACSQSGVYTTGNNSGGGITVTCTTAAVVPAASSLPGQAVPIRIAVVPRLVPGVLVVPAATVVTLVNTANVAGGGEPAGNTGNNSGQVSVPVTIGATIMGRVWQDIPSGATALPNRLYDAGLDRPLGNWKVEVLDPTTLTVLKSTATLSNSGATQGTYTVTDLAPGTYYLQFRDPTNNVVSGTAVCAATAAAADPTATALGGPNYGGSYNPANCQTPTGGGAGAVNSQLDATGRYLRITLQGGDTIIDQNLPLDPSGIVYDASTGAAVAGTTVRITALNALTRTPLTAAQFNPVTGFVGGVDNVITGADGFYQFLLTFSGQTQCALAPGGRCLLELAVTPTTGYQPFSVSTTVFPPSASTGTCGAFAPNCLDGTGGAGFIDASGAMITVPPIPTTSRYYLRFLVDNNSRELLNNHLPLVSNAVTANNLFVKKVANRTEAEQGDFADYTISVLNGTVVAANPVIITDRLPAGFKYVAGTARYTAPGATVPVVQPDPSGGAGPVLGFNIGNLAAGTTATLTYRVQLSINAPLGDGKNLASAAAPGLGSNTATATIKVRGGVFTDKGYIVGTVFLDCNRDRVQGAREPGIPGVRLFMEDGTTVVTDAEGKYSLYGVSPRTHVMKVDDITLPRGSELIALNNRNAGDPSSRFVDVKVGEMARADFAEGSCAPAVLAEVKARREKGETGAAELNRATGAAFSAQVTAPLSSSSLGAPASGVIAAPVAAPALPGATPAAPAPFGGATPAAAPAAPASGGAAVKAIPFVTAPASGVATVPDAASNPGVQTAPVPVYQPLNAAGAAGSVNSSNSNLPAKTGDLTAAQLPDVARAPLIARPLEEVLPELDNSFAILDLKDGDTLPIAQVNIRIKGTAGSKFVLSVNGAEVPATRIGKRSVLESKQSQAWEFIGVDLKPGVNLVIAKQMDQFGNVRGETGLKLVAPGSLGKIVIDAPASASADGTTPIEVKISLTDDKGVPVTTRTAVTLSTNLGRFEAVDLNPAEPGVQVFLQNGGGVFRMVPAGDPGDATITVVAGNLREQKKVAFVPHLRPLTGAGIIEGAFRFNSLSLKNMVAAQQRDGFEQQITRFAYASSDGKHSADARAAMFLKGKIKGEYLLTLAYDSDKDLKERVFRDISPDEFYPVYGDSSARGYDAQTTGRFYVRVDKGRSFVLYGDFNTASPVQARTLSQYSRTLTGAKWHLEGSNYQGTAFASRDTFRQVVLEFNANGTSGPFDLALPSGAVINSEKVEVLTRDRNQPAVILQTVQKGRFSDYEIEPYVGRLLFKGPVASLDANLNPQSIRVTYEMDQGGKPFWVGGVDGQYQLTDKLEIGGMVVKDQNPAGEFSMGGLNATYKFTDKTVLVAETARTNREAAAVSVGPATGAIVGSGNASRVELRHSDGPIDGRIAIGRSDINFDNPSSTLNRGRNEASGRITYKLSPSTAVTGEALHTGDLSTGASRDAISLRADHAFENGIKLTVGIANVKDENPAAATLAGVASSGAIVTNTGYTSVRARVTVPVPNVPQASVFGEYEAGISGDERKVASLGGEYKFSEFGRVYGRYESGNSNSSLGGLTTVQKSNITVFGIDTSLTKDTKAFSEYRGRSSFDGSAAEAAIGLRNNWQIAEGLRLGTSFERIQPFQRLATAITSSEATAVTAAIDYTANPLWKGSTRLELRSSDTSDSILSTIAVGYKLSREWSLLARSSYSHTAVKGATPGDQDRLRIQVGAAYRDTDSNKWNMVTRFEHRDEKDTTIAPVLKRALNLASLHFNYQPERSLILTGRYATKYVNEDSGGISSKSSGHLIAGRATYDINSRWDIGLTASLHTDGGLSNRKFGIGLEVGYMVQENLWLSAGYNFFGFKDKDLAGADYTDRGVYVRMRYKFDETLFDWKRDGKLRGDTAMQ